MPAAPTVLVHGDSDLLAAAVAARLVTRVVDAQAARGHASIVLTGGGIGTKTLAAVHTSPARDAVDWRRVSVWWGDERFLPSGDPERNETSARQALLDHVDLDPANVHVMPPSDGPYGDDAEAAAAAYAEELARSDAADFDVLMLGIGPDTHVASLFPGMAALGDERTVIPVHGAPKPPPTRLSLTLPTIQSAREVWVLASGAEKAGAVRQALADADPADVPSVGARGRLASLFLLDADAAAEIS